MPKKDRPIIERATDTDLYKFTVSQFAWWHHPDVEVEFAFTNRKKDIRLAEIIDMGRLREELEAARNPAWLASDVEFMREHALPNGVLTFAESFLGYQTDLVLPEYHVEVKDGQPDIRIRGPWPAVTMAETRCLSVVNELYYDALERRGEFDRVALMNEGLRRLEENDRILRESFERFPPLVSRCLVEFGTRRRFSRAWQRTVYAMRCKRLLRHVAGTSNVAMAVDFDHQAFGTYPHECEMAYQGIYGATDQGLLDSQWQFWDDWHAFYGAPLSVLLADTYGSHGTLERFGRRRAVEWRGPRHDSGDPFEFGERVIAWLDSLGIDPKTKFDFWSDGLSAQLIADLNERFGRRIQCLYGQGTKWSNDLGLETLSIVMKLVRSNGRDTFKLSDNFAKTQGPPEVVARGKRVFAYRDEDYGYTPCEV